ncbi:uncharacterized protein [Chironomus tepperi]|uniref:uncharacterized protein n=1 Tax=Chironomus tepperi TaxID=113505 RepID=UPI00391EFD9D
MEWSEFIFWVIFTIFMTIVFPVVLGGIIFCCVSRSQSQITTVPSTPYVIDQTSRQPDDPPRLGFVIPTHLNNDIHRNSVNDSSVNIQIRDVPPPYSSIPGSQFPGLQTQLPYPEHNAMHFPIPSHLDVQFNTEKINLPPVFPNAPAAPTVQPSNPPVDPAYQISVQATYQNELNNQSQNQASFQAQVAIPNSIPMQTLTRPTTLAISSIEQSVQNQFIPIPTPFTSQEPTTFPPMPMPSSSSNRTVNSTEHDDPPPSYHKIDKL